MTTLPTSLSKQGDRALPTEPFGALIAYEDLDSGQAARRCLDHLSRDLGADACLTLWRLDMLNKRELAERAAQDASSADVVLLSLRGEHPLSSVVKEWLRAWLELPGERDSALGVLLEWKARQTQTANETLAFLHRATQRHPVDLFVGYFRAVNHGSPLSDEGIQRHVATKKHVPEGFLHRPAMRSSHWGINE